MCPTAPPSRKRTVTKQTWGGSFEGRPLFLIQTRFSWLKPGPRTSSMSAGWNLARILIPRPYIKLRKMSKAINGDRLFAGLDLMARHWKLDDG